MRRASRVTVLITVAVVGSTGCGSTERHGISQAQLDKLGISQAERAKFERLITTRLRFARIEKRRDVEENRRILDRIGVPEGSRFLRSRVFALTSTPRRDATALSPDEEMLFEEYLDLTRKYGVAELVTATAWQSYRNYKTPRHRTVAELRDDVVKRAHGWTLLDDRRTKIGANLTFFRAGRCLIIRFGVSEHPRREIDMLVWRDRVREGICP